MDQSINIFPLCTCASRGSRCLVKVSGPISEEFEDGPVDKNVKTLPEKDVHGELNERVGTQLGDSCDNYYCSMGYNLDQYQLVAIPRRDQVRKVIGVRKVQSLIQILKSGPTILKLPEV